MTKKEMYKELNKLLKEWGITKEECYFRTGYEYSLDNYVNIRIELNRWEETLYGNRNKFNG